jgi:hypothetical protein
LRNDVDVFEGPAFGDLNVLQTKQVFMRPQETHEFDFSADTLCIDKVMECIAYLFDCNFGSVPGVGCAYDLAVRAATNQLQGRVIGG